MKSNFFIIVFTLFSLFSQADDSILSHAEREVINSLAGKPLPQQAEFIRKKVNIEVLKSDKKESRHYFDFLGEATKSIDDVSDLEGHYGKVQCPSGKITAILYVSDDAPPTTLIHEFIHFYEMEQERRWCELDARVLESDEKKEKALLYHRFEFETLKTLYENQNKITMNFEDRLLMLEGLSRENKTLTLLGMNTLDEKTQSGVGRDLEVMHSQISYITWLSRTREDAGSVLEKMEILNLRGCVENSKGEDVFKKVNACLEARCTLSKMKCKKIVASDLAVATHDPLLLVIAAWTSKTPNLYESCPVTKLRDEFQDHLQDPSPCWKKFYTQTHFPIDVNLISIKPRAISTLFNAPVLNVDEKISFQKASTPQSFIQKAYCYSVFQKTAGYGAIPIDQFAYATQGAVINTDLLEKYRNWLDDKEGQACDKLVTMFAGEGAYTFKARAEHKKYIFIINPLAALSGGLDNLKTYLATDINHERLHIIFTENKGIQRVVRREWQRLSPTEKNNFKNHHPQYDFTEEEIMLKEYFAYSHQTEPKNL